MEHMRRIRAFNDWLRNDWLSENNYTLSNVVVFDFYNVLTSPEAHHRLVGGQIEYIRTDRNTLYYPSGDDHPSRPAARKQRKNSCRCSAPSPPPLAGGRPGAPPINPMLRNQTNQ
jgi:hypothetical protein